ncbi:MAG: class III poly(R)-hydroxyalkanoic acid synthase subunit PhaC [Proteobacteria bacterium]|nr:class III poly(R)-hydroxyalkanoic acid synthase subunit PhaC [Pseudomonadota bacterium]
MFGSKEITENFLSKMADGVEMYQDYLQNASRVMLGPLETTISSTPHEIVYTEDRVKLKHYTPGKDVTSKMKTPLLVTYALINRETMLDLQPDRSVVKSFLKDGIELYMIDWGYPTRKDRYLTIDDHVNGYMDNVVEFIRKRHNVEKINLMGICMGGTFSAMYASLYPEKIKNLITTVTPTSFDTRDGLLHTWAQGIDADKMVETFGNIPADLMNFGFLLLNPARLMIDKYKNFMENMGNKSYVENFVRMEKWIFDSPDVPGETFRQFIKDCYQKNLLIQGKMEIGDKRIDLKKITMPLLNIFSKYDHLVPPAASNQLTGAVGSKDKEDVCLATGHIGIYVSSRFQQEFAPRISAWLGQRDTVEEKREKVVKPKLAGKAVATIVKDQEKKPEIPPDIPSIHPNPQNMELPNLTLKQA